MRFFKDTENIFSVLLLLVFFLPWSKDGSGVELFKDAFSAVPGDLLASAKLAFVAIPVLAIVSIALNMASGKGRMLALVNAALTLGLILVVSLRYVLSQAEIAKLQIASLVPGSIFSYLSFGAYLAIPLAVLLLLASLKVVKIHFEE